MAHLDSGLSGIRGTDLTGMRSLVESMNRLPDLTGMRSLAEAMNRLPDLAGVSTLSFVRPKWLDGIDPEALREATADIQASDFGAITDDDLQAAHDILQQDDPQHVALYAVFHQSRSSKVKAALIAIVMHGIKQWWILLLLAIANGSIRDVGMDSPARVVKNVKRLLNATSGSKAVSPTLRIVRRRVKAHSGWKRSSQVIAVLDVGTIVRVVDKRAKWTRIEWIENGKPLVGWVRSKYLARVNR